MAAIWNICKRGAPSANTSLACCRSTYVARQGGRHDRTHPRWSLRMSLTKKQLDDIRRRAERGSGAWTGEAIYDWRKLLVELDRLSRIEDKYNNLCPVLNEQAGEIGRMRIKLSWAREALKISYGFIPPELFESPALEPSGHR